MDLPPPYELNELNRVLIAVRELDVQGQGCSVNSVTKLCSSFVFGGRPVDHARTLRLCCYAGLLSVKKRIVALTQLGNEFLNLNPKFLYEINDFQKFFLAQKIVFKGPWDSRARDLFLSFSPNYYEITYELSLIDNPPALRHNSIIQILKTLNVLVESDFKLVVTPGYVAFVNQLLADRRGISEKQLDQALLANRQLSTQAEEAVLQFERKRLRGLGRNAEAELVRKISQLNIGAGYDIESFDGDKPLFDYDRFIEVKASQGSELHFFWSANERRVAEEKGGNYWIYFVSSFRRGNSDKIVPIMIRNPAKQLSLIKQVNVGIATYIITQCGDLPLNLICQGNVKGFVL